MGQNIIEIILDTSESMGEQIFSSWKVTKFDLAKEVLVNLFTERDKHKCTHSLSVRCVQNTRLIKMEDINELNTINPQEKLSLSQVIENSIEELTNLDEEYQHKILIILTDGKNQYDIEQEIDSTIKIYTMEIGGLKGTPNQNLKNLSNTSGGLSYSVLVENNSDKDIEKMHSEIKKYFKCLKFPMIGLGSLLLIGLLYFLIPISFKSCQGQHSYFSKDFKDSSITSCKKITVNGIDSKKCIFIPDKSVQAIIYRHDSSSVIVLKNFVSAKSDMSKTHQEFLKEIMQRVNLEPNSIKKIQIFGHTDLESVDKNKAYYFNKNCESFYNVKKSTNECLGNERAFQVKKIISETDYGLLTISAQYNDDFFMQNMNNKLGGSLWNVLNLNEETALLMKKLAIGNEYIVKDIRKNGKIQQKIQADKRWYQQKFKPFRNVIVIIK